MSGVAVDDPLHTHWLCQSGEHALGETWRIRDVPFQDRSRKHGYVKINICSGNLQGKTGEFRIRIIDQCDAGRVS